MLGQEGAKFALKPAIAQCRVRTEDTNGVHSWFDAKLIAQIRLYVSNQLFPFRRTKQISFTDKNHGAGASVIKRLHDDEIIRSKTCTRIDQNNPEIAAREICDRFLRTRNCKGAKPRRINKSNAFRQTVGRQFHENPCDV